MADDKKEIKQDVPAQDQDLKEIIKEIRDTRGPAPDLEKVYAKARRKKRTSWVFRR